MCIPITPAPYLENYTAIKIYFKIHIHIGYLGFSSNYRVLFQKKTQCNIKLV